MKTIEFTVFGTPKPAGSKKGFPVRRKNGTLGVAISDSSGTAGREWRALVQDRARTAMDGSPLVEGPLRLSASFYLARPKGHTGKKGLRASAPPHPATKPDTTKLLRALEDALTGIVWRDDSQVVTQHAFKRYTIPGGAPGVVVRVSEEVAL